MRTVSLSTRQQERAVGSPQRTTSVVTGAATFVTARLKSEGIGALHPQCIPKELIAAMPHMGIDGGMDECSGIVSLIQRLVCCWERHLAISEDGQQLARLLNRRGRGLKRSWHDGRWHRRGVAVAARRAKVQCI